MNRRWENYTHQMPYAKGIKFSDTLAAVNELLLAWDPDFTKLTPEEKLRLKVAEEEDLVDERDIDWNNLDQYV